MSRIHPASSLVSPDDSSDLMQSTAMKFNNITLGDGRSIQPIPRYQDENLKSTHLKHIPKKDKDHDVDSELEESDTDRDDGDNDDLDDTTQLKELRTQARMLESLGDIGAAEWAYEEALRIDPLDLRTLTSFAVFLHRKKGDLEFSFLQLTY